MTNEEQVQYLNFLVKEYIGVTKLIASTKQRLQSLDRKSTRLNSSHIQKSRMPSSA